MVNVNVRFNGTTKKYKLEGPLFFGSAMRFHNFFDVDNDPDNVVLFMDTKPTEYSAVDALARVGSLYAAQKKTFTLEFGDADAEAPAPARTSPKAVPATPTVVEMAEVKPETEPLPESVTP